MISSLDISVVVPIYNGADKLDQLIECFLCQTARPLELVLIDDGSKDGLDARIKDYKQYTWLKYHKQENGGPASARNRGLYLAAGQYVAFLDADDVWLPKKIEMQVACMNAYRGQRKLGLVDTFIMAEYPNGMLRYARRINDGDMREGMLYQNRVNGTSSVIIDKELALACGGFPEQFWFGEDRMLWTQVAQSHDFATVPEILVKKINRPDNLTSRTMENYQYIVRYIDFLIQEYGRPDNKQRIFFENTEFIFRRFVKERNRAGLSRCLADSWSFSSWRTIFSLRPLAYCLVSCLSSLQKN